MILNTTKELFLVYLPEILLTGILIALLFTDLSQKKYKVKGAITMIAAGLIAAITILISVSGWMMGEISTGSDYVIAVNDGYGLILRGMIMFTFLVVILLTYLDNELLAEKMRQGQLYILLVSFLPAMMISVTSVDLLLTYVTVEFMSLISYVLAGYIRLSVKSSEASIKYFLYGASASAVMLFGISLIWGAAGTFQYNEIRDFLTETKGSYELFGAGFLMVVLGMGYKMASAPFHFWSPDVFEGSAISVTSLFAVTTKVAAFGIFARIIHTFFPVFSDAALAQAIKTNLNYDAVIMVLSISSMFIGNIAALRQKNIKRLLAYSGISHAGFILSALLISNAESVSSLLAYIIIYAIMNIGAFLTSTILVRYSESEDISSFKGLGYKHPLTAVSLVIFVVSLIGLPPTAGFFVKFYLFTNLIDSGYLVIALIALLTTVISIYYYFNLLRTLYQPQEKDISESVFSLPAIYYILLLMLVTPVIIFGVWFKPVLNLSGNFGKILGIN